MIKKKMEGIRLLDLLWATVGWIVPIHYLRSLYWRNSPGVTMVRVSCGRFVVGCKVVSLRSCNFGSVQGRSVGSYRGDGVRTRIPTPIATVGVRHSSHWSVRHWSIPGIPVALAVASSRGLG